MAEPSSSHLPSWALKMREKINESRIKHSLAESRLDNLQSSIDVLSEKIETLRPQQYDTSDANVEGNTGLVKTYTFRFEYLPSDTLGEILKYLTIPQATSLEILSDEIKCAVFNSISFWFDMFSLYCPHLSKASCGRGNMRSVIIAHVKVTTECIKFIRTMKEQRSILRHNTIAPHRHSTKEKTVTHPLPVFDKGAGNHGDVGKMMSRAETFSSDFRSIAHKALESMFRVTSNPDDPLHEQLASEGAVTVLISLLSNESGALQNYSCGILANLLCWESKRERLVRMCQKVVGHSGHILQFKALQGQVGERKSIAAQIEACNGHRQLMTLLTSPTA